MTGERRSAKPIDTTFEFGEEPAVIKYTTDGSKPTESSPGVGLDRAARAGRGVWRDEVDDVQVDMATDIKGNVSNGEREVQDQ